MRITKSFSWQLKGTIFADSFAEIRTDKFFEDLATCIGKQNKQKRVLAKLDLLGKMSLIQNL
jgi:hypothetical protein